jgi:hypothetical protein
MANNQEVAWAWSFIDPINILFIFRFGGREIKIDLREYLSGSTRYHVIWLSEKETQILTKLKE